MKKVILVLAIAFGLILVLSSCRDELDDTYTDVEMIDNDEVKEDDI